jgi:molybdopterin-guanine dinucleotide biosynthesis protein A
MITLEPLISSLEQAKLTFDAGILAGGKSLRMGGQDKALITLDDNVMVSSAVRLLKPLAVNRQVLINSNKDPENYKFLSQRICHDAYPGFRGPLAGLHALLSNSDSDILFVVPCDTPFINEPLINALGQRAVEQQLSGSSLRPIALQCENFKHPLHCCLPRACLDSIAHHIEHGKHKLIRWFEENEADWISVPDTSTLVNVNTPEELQRAKLKLSNS